MDLSGKVAVVTCSGRGLGLAYAQELARAGAAVVVNDVGESVARTSVASITVGVGGDRFAGSQQTVGQQLPEAPK